jgi:hypothetical protein
MKYSRIAAALLVWLWGVSCPALADVRVSVSSFSTVDGTTAQAFIGVTPFDATLGSLDSVNVTINGVLTVTGITVPNIAGPAGPVPYPYLVSVSQDYFGLLGKYFDFNGDATFLIQGQASGVGEPLSILRPFNYGFTFNETTDLIGFVIPSVSGGVIPPGGGVSGSLSDFLDTIVPIDEIDLVQTATAFALSPPVVVTSTHAAGAIIIQYNFTPAQATVPAPNTGALLTLGLVAFALSRRRTAK